MALAKKGGECSQKEGMGPRARDEDRDEDEIRTEGVFGQGYLRRSEEQP